MEGKTGEVFALFLLMVAFVTAATGRCDKALDVIFGVPNSASLGLVEFNNVKSSLKQLVDRYDVSNSRTHIGVVLYNDHAHLAVPLNNAYSRKAVWDLIDELPSNEMHGFNTAAGMRVAADHAFTMFGGVRQSRPKILVVFAPRQSTSSPEELQAAATKLKENGVRLMVFGVSRHASPGTYSNLVTQPQSRFLISANSYSDIGPALDEIERTTCQVKAGKCPLPAEVLGDGGSCEIDKDCSEDLVCCEDDFTSFYCTQAITTHFTPFDMAIAIDNSEAATREDFKQMKSFVNDLIRPYANSENSAHFGLQTFAGTTTKVTKGFRNFLSTQQLDQIISTLPKTQDPKRRIDLTLRAAVRDFFSAEGGSRRGLDRYLLVLTSDGTSPGSGNIVEAAEDLNSMGVKRIAVAVNSEVPQKFLDEVASDKSLAFRATEANNLPQIATNIKDVINRANKVKPGLCPGVDPIDPNLCPTIPDPDRIPCGESGREDIDWACPGEQKCCMDSNGCSRYCTDPPIVCKEDRDLLVLLENTDAIGKRRSFELLKETASRLISAFNVSRQNTHVAMATYTGSSRSTIRFRHREAYDLKAAQDRIKGASFKGGKLASVKAALDAAVEAFNPTGGERAKMNKTIVLIGAGNVLEPERARDIAQELRLRKIDIYAVTIGNKASYSALREIVSHEPSENIFSVTSADALNAQLRPLVDTVCKGAIKDIMVSTCWCLDFNSRSIPFIQNFTHLSPPAVHMSICFCHYLLH